MYKNNIREKVPDINNYTKERWIPTLMELPSLI